MSDSRTAAQIILFDHLISGRERIQRDVSQRNAAPQRAGVTDLGAPSEHRGNGVACRKSAVPGYAEIPSLIAALVPSAGSFQAKPTPVLWVSRASEFCARRRRAHVLTGRKSMVRTFMIAAACAPVLMVSPTAFAQGQFGTADEAKAMLVKIGRASCRERVEEGVRCGRGSR